MHTFTSLISLTSLLFASSAQARYWPTTAKGPWNTFPDDCKCLTASDASHLINGYMTLLNSTFSATLADDIVAPTFTEYSDSTNYLAGIPAGAPTFNSSAGFALHQSYVAPVPTQLLGIDFTCTAITYRWLSFYGPQYPVRAVSVAYAVEGNGSANGWQLATNYVEFNVGNVVKALNGTCALPATGASS